MGPGNAAGSLRLTGNACLRPLRRQLEALLRIYPTVASGIVNRPRLSVIINNYNYERFLRSALESARSQSYSNLEVVVVDDGSTDQSREILAAEGGDASLIFKPNGGQASAFNAGFAHSTGDIVIFLDADDVLLPGAAQSVVEAFERAPGAAKVHYPLEIIDAGGEPTGRHEPPGRLMEGDLRGQVARHHAYKSPPTSGNAFPRWLLDRLLPMPEHGFEGATERYLVDLAPLFGPIVAIPHPCGQYRRHGANETAHPNHRIGPCFLPWVRQNVRRMRLSRAHQRRIGDELGYQAWFPPPEDDAWLGDAAHRLISYKLDRQGHPVRDDRLGRIVRSGLRTSLSRGANPMTTWMDRLVRAAWFLAVAGAPRPIALWLVEQYYLPGARLRAVDLILRLCRVRPEVAPRPATPSRVDSTRLPSLKSG